MNSEVEEDKQINQNQIESEVDALLEKSRPKGQNPYELNIDFEELDEVFQIKDEIPNLKVDKKAIKQMVSEYEKELEKEIEEEIAKTYVPSFSDEDKKRVEHLLKTDGLIRQALTDKMITKEELFMFIDYYEILSLTNRTQRETLIHFKALNELLNKDVEGNDKEKSMSPLDKLTEEIEDKINVSESILSSKSDYQKELNNQKEYLASQLEKNTLPVSHSQAKTEASKTNSAASKEEDLKRSKISETNSLLQSQERKTKSNTNRINMPIKTKIELFNDNNQITNLMKVRNDRKEIIKANYKQKGSYRPDLFKFPKLKSITENNKQFQFSQMFEGPKVFLEKTKMDPEKKSLVRKKIEDAQKYYKNK